MAADREGEGGVAAGRYGGDVDFDELVVEAGFDLSGADVAGGIAGG